MRLGRVLLPAVLVLVSSISLSDRSASAANDSQFSYFMELWKGACAGAHRRVLIDSSWAYVNCDCALAQLNKLGPSGYRTTKIDWRTCIDLSNMMKTEKEVCALQKYKRVDCDCVVKYVTDSLQQWEQIASVGEFMWNMKEKAAALRLEGAAKHCYQPGG